MSKELSKSDVRYWQERIFKETSRAKGKDYERSDFSVRIHLHGRRERFQLDTPNKYAAARKAREIYQYLLANDWEQTLIKFKPQSKVAAKSDVTIGEFLAELRTLHASRVKTIENYAVPLRRIATEVASIPSAGCGGNAANHRIWREKVEAVKLSLLTLGKVKRWKEAFLVRAGNDPVKQRSARVTVNSALREARSLFAPKMLEGLENIILPSPLPFTGITMEKRQSMRYRSTFDIRSLIKSAREELAPAKPEQFKIFVLAVMVGLRRNEIDKLEWSSFNWSTGTISIVATKYFRPKSDDSARSVWVPAEMLELFRKYRSCTGSPFVVESDVRPIMDKPYDHYRCSTLFDNLIAWLRAKSVTANKPLHDLRKEYGSQIAANFGIYAAKEMLGHSDIATTAAHYLEAKGRPNIGMGDLLQAPTNIIPIEASQDTLRA